MRALMHLFSALLIPVSLFLAVLLTLYFTVDYSFSQAMKLGVLYGLFAGIIITLILSVTINFLRERKEKNLHKLQTETSLSQEIDESVKNGTDHKLMLLMRKELIFEIILSMVKKSMPQAKTSHHINKGNIHIQIDEETTSISVISITRQTSEVVINSVNNSKQAQHIFSLLKEKEQAFLKY